MDETTLMIKKIAKKGGTIDYDIDYGEEWSKHLSKKDMFIKYDENIEKVPDSIAIIPLICNILPIMWLFNLKIYVEEIDETFKNSVPKIRRGYEKMYPGLRFLGDLEYGKIVKNNFSGCNSAVMFSGGVDAFSTLITNIKRKPDLITIYGADISLNDDEALRKVKKLNMETSARLGLSYQGIYSDFRALINYRDVTRYVCKQCKCEWWHDFQHGIGLLGLTAPLAYVNEYKTVYIASSFTPADIGKYTCASDPTIDNNYSHSSSITIHDGYEKNRQMKINNICKYVKDNKIKIRLRVCWESEGGDNCCSCEKCYRTIMGILAANGKPENFGFTKYEANKAKMIKYLKANLKYNTRNGFKPNYQPIQDEMIKSGTVDNEFLWFAKYKIANKKPTMYYLKTSLGGIPRKAIKRASRFNRQNS